MDKQYFTPDIEDIRIGYECEIKPAKSEHFNWMPYIVSADNSFKNYFRDSIRTPYLTKEQIGAEGWQEITTWLDETKKQSLGFKPNYELKTEKGALRLYLKDINDLQKGFTIEMYTKSSGEAFSLSSFITVFSGNCKCINNFRSIIKLLKIT